MASVALTAAQRTRDGVDVLRAHGQHRLYTSLSTRFLQICALLASIGLFFLIYWGLPNRKIPLRAVLPTAIVMGVLWRREVPLHLALPRLDFRSVYGPFACR